MFWFIVSIIFLLIGVIWLLVGPSYPTQTLVNRDGYQQHETQQVSIRQFGWIPLGIGLLLLFLSSFTVVGARNVGVEKLFSATTGRTMDAGFHWKAPWHSVQDIDAKIKPEEYQGDHCIRVKIADGGTACVDVAYRWRINPDGAAKIYADYGSSDDVDNSVKKALVSTNIKAAINEVLGTYNPLSGAVVSEKMTPEELANLKINVVPDYEKINNEIRDNVDQKIANLGDLIQIESVTVSGVNLPQSTQNKIIKFNQAAQDTKIAIQQEATKAAQAQGNLNLASSVKNDPGVLVSKCLDGLEQGTITNEPGFSCWPGNGSSVIIPGK